MKCTKKTAPCLQAHFAPCFRSKVSQIHFVTETAGVVNSLHTEDSANAVLRFKNKDGENKEDGVVREPWNLCLLYFSWIVVPFFWRNFVLVRLQRS